ncbi:MAG: methyltransferase [Succinivibrio sp.]
MPNFYSDLKISSLDAISKAQEIIHGPILFQAIYTLFEHGVLDVIDKARDGITLAEIAQKSDLNEYALGVLLDMACSGKVVLVSDDGKYSLSKVGYFIINDTMTKVNFDFVKHVCYNSMDRLDDAVTTGKPSGLAVFNKDWETIYPHLSELPGKAKDSWFAWDHLYSQTAFKDAILKINELYSPKLIYDVGGNTGKFAIRCCELLADAKVHILDLKEQIRLAKENIRAHGLEDRIDFIPVDILKDNVLPHDADIWWMSQFLDCFSEDQVLTFLSSIAKSIKDGGRVCILEPIADRQKFEAASMSINAGSLYFTAIANGYSRFFTTATLTKLIEKAGFTIEHVIDNLGITNSLFICKKA